MWGRKDYSKFLVNKYIKKIKEERCCFFIFMIYWKEKVNLIFFVYLFIWFDRIEFFIFICLFIGFIEIYWVFIKLGGVEGIVVDL